MSCMIHYWSITCHALGYLTPVTYLSYLRWIVTNHQSPHIHSCFRWTVTNPQSCLVSWISNQLSRLVLCIINQSPIIPWTICHQSIIYHALFDVSPIVHYLLCLFHPLTNRQSHIMPCMMYYKSITCYALYHVLQINHLSCLVRSVTYCPSPNMPCLIRINHQSPVMAWMTYFPALVAVRAIKATLKMAPIMVL